jgi:hypothetical protein
VISAQMVYVYMQGILMDCVSDMQMVAEGANDDYSGGNKGSPMGLGCPNEV